MWGTWNLNPVVCCSTRPQQLLVSNRLIQTSSRTCQCTNPWSHSWSMFFNFAFVHMCMMAAAWCMTYVYVCVRFEDVHASLTSLHTFLSYPHPPSHSLSLLITTSRSVNDKKAKFVCVVDQYFKDVIVDPIP